MKNLIGTKITEIRKKQGFTQEELAEKANLSLKTIQRIESGENKPRGYTLSAISKALDINIENLQDYGKVEDKSFFTYFHLSVIAGCFIPLGDILVPGILWLSKRDKIAGLNKTGKNLLTFRIIFDLLVFVIVSLSMYKSMEENNFIFTNSLLFYLIVNLIVTLAYPIYAGISIRLNGKLKSFYPSFFN